MVRSLICGLLRRHRPVEFIRNVYGDEVIELGFKRSIWRCTHCKTILYKPELHKEVKK